MTFWTKQPIVNIKYIFLTSVLLPDTVFVKPTWNKKLWQVHIGLNCKGLGNDFFILNHNNVMHKKFISPGLNIYSPGLYILQVEVYSPGLNSPF